MFFCTPHQRTAIVAALLVVLSIGFMRLPLQAQEAGFTIHDVTFTSNYPAGMTFTIQAESDAGDITNATAFYVLRSGTQERAIAAYDSDAEAWIASAYDNGGLPPWIDFEVRWLLTDAQGNSFETEPQYAIYADATREWQRMDTDDMTLYWFGFAEDAAAENGNFGEMVAAAMADMRAQYAAGWGANLSFKPIVIFFPDQEGWGEFAAGNEETRAAGYTNNGWGYTVLQLASENPPDFLAECVERWGYSTERDMTWRLERGISSIVHEVAHIHQSDFRVGGPSWWIEGQADYFASLTGLDSDPDGRLTNYVSVTNDLPTLQGAGPSPGAGTLAADSCNGLGYDLGNDFIQWLLAEYDGLETHHQIVAEIQKRVGLETALENVTGASLLALENQWRASWGLDAIGALPTPTPFTLPTAPAFDFLATPTPMNP